MRAYRWLVGVSLLLLCGCASTDSGGSDPRLKSTSTNREQLRLALDDERAKTHILSERLAIGARQRDATRAAVTASRNRIAELERENQQLQALLERRENQPLEKPEVAASPLPENIDRALAAFARRHAERVSYVRDRAAVSFANDRLFETGSDVVRSDAHAALAELADIVAGLPAEEYEVLIVGHTDDTPISRPETRARHPSNWHLSVHRAIAIKNVLVAAGLPDARMGVMGYGPNRPVGTDKARNRRVEIFLVPRGEVRSRAALRPGS